MTRVFNKMMSNNYNYYISNDKNFWFKDNIYKII